MSRSGTARTFLSEAAAADVARRTPSWGFPVGPGLSLGELVFVEKYSRLLPDGRRERWADVCCRVVDGTFAILHEHCRDAGRPWSDRWAEGAAARMLESMFDFRWLPPGRGLWTMGTDFIREHGGAPLQNCAFVSSASSNPSDPFVRLMEMSMLGVGVGFDTAAAGRTTVRPPAAATAAHVIDDSREGWCRSLRALLDAYLLGAPMPDFNYGAIRPAGAPIRRFGGVSGGPEPLRRLHEEVARTLRARVGTNLGSADVVDLMNLIGRSVAMGGIRRAAQIALGSSADADFVRLKSAELHPDRMGADGWGHLSNNSVVLRDGESPPDAVWDQLLDNGEPGFLFLDRARRHGRMADDADEGDASAAGTNPCGEQTLEDREVCTLVEVFPTRARSQPDLLESIEHAWLYAKAVTLLETGWPDTDAIVARNRRVGCSLSGVADFVHLHGVKRLVEWVDAGYRHLRSVDHRVSTWLDVPRSKKSTSVKPSGTVSLLAGVSPGVHHPVGGDGVPYVRRLWLRRDAPASALLRAAGYEVEMSSVDGASTVTACLPIAGSSTPAAHAVTIETKAMLARVMQRHWADNQVSVTLTFAPEEAARLAADFDQLTRDLKCATFLPDARSLAGRVQLPFEPLDGERFERARSRIRPFDRDALYGVLADPDMSPPCDTDACAVDGVRRRAGG